MVDLFTADWVGSEGTGHVPWAAGLNVVRVGGGLLGRQYFRMTSLLFQELGSLETGAAVKLWSTYHGRRVLTSPCASAEDCWANRNVFLTSLSF